MNSQPTADPLVGRTLGEFRLERRIGEGGFGAVYRARQVALDRPAVVKVLLSAFRHRVDQAQRFLSEAKLASRLDHPYAAHIYAFGAEPDGVLWIAMELVRGIPLNTLLKLQGALPLTRFAPLFERICEVVHAAHEQGIIHRDIKPPNVMVMSRGGRLLPKLLDFGIAKFLGADLDDGTERAFEAATPPAREPSPQADDHPPESGDPDEQPPQRATRAIGRGVGAPLTTGSVATPAGMTNRRSRDLTATGEAMGSPAYMAPEQWVSGGVVDARTDIYALGVLAYQCLTRRLPFVEETTRAIAEAHTSKPMPALEGAFPVEVDALLRKALAKAKDDRFATALELGEAMRLAAGARADLRALPELDDQVRQLAMLEAPQPLAEAVGALAAAHNAHQARDSMWLVVHVAARLLGLIAIAARTRVGAGEAVDAEGVAELLRQLRRRALDDGEWVSLARELCRPFARRAEAYPVPELVGAFFDDEGEALPLFERLFELRDQVTGGTEEQAHVGLQEGLPQVAQLLRRLEFLTRYQLMVPRGERHERWMGVRMAVRSVVPLVDKDRTLLHDGHPLLADGEGNIVLSLFPLLQVVRPAPGVPEELFLLEGQGRNGARLVALPAGFERHEAAFWEQSRSALVQIADQGPSALDERAPYRGLSTFRPEDAAIFFGREREAEALVNRLRLQGLVAVVGPSGAGKSSFVQAGVIPNLPPGWKALTVRPGAQPLAALRARLAKEGILLPLGSSVQTTAEAIRRGAQTLCGAVGGGALLLVVDQFEELFTLCADGDERTRYAELIAALGGSVEQPVRVVITLRDDFLIRADEMVTLREGLAVGLQLVTTPAAEDLLRIVLEPARRSGYSFDDPALPSTMVEAVVGQAGALPLLSFTASRLWELRDRTGHVLPKKAYDAMGGVGGALAQHAEQTLEAMAPEERGLVREAFRRLVTSEGTRAVLSRAELLEVIGDRTRGEAVLEKLIAARLLCASEAAAETDAGGEQIEVVHEALLAAWPRLVSWRSEDAEGARLRDQLRQAAQQWAARGRPRGLLWRDEALTEYQIWRQRFGGRATALEDEFGSASTAYALAGRRLRRTLLALVVTALTVFVVVLGVANKRVTASSRLAKEALAQSNEEQGRQLLLDGKPLEALVYLHEAFAAGHQGPGMRFMLGRILHLWSAQKYAVPLDPPTTETRASPAAANADHGINRAFVAGHSASIEVSFDGKLVATATGTDHVQILATSDGHLVARVSLPGERLTSARFSPDGKLVALAGRGVTVWEPATGRTQPLAGSEHLRSMVSWSLDGQKLRLQSPMGGRVLDPRSGAVLEKWPGMWGLLRAANRGPRTLIAQEDTRITARTAGGAVLVAQPVGEVTMSDVQPETGRLATADEHGLRVWKDGVATTMPGKPQTFAILLFGPGHSPLLAGVDITGVATVWDVDAVKEVAQLTTTGANTAAFSPDGKRLMLGYSDGRIRLYDAASWEPLAWLYGRRDIIFAAAFVEDGLLVGSSDGTLALFDITPREPLFVTKLPGDTRALSASIDRATNSVWATTSDGSALRFNLTDGQQEERIDLKSPHGALQTASLEDHAQYVLSSAAGYAQLWNLPTRTVEWAWQADAHPLSFGQLSPDGRHLVTAVHGVGLATLWDRQTHAALHTFQRTNAPDTCVFDSTGQRLLISGAGEADIFNVATGAVELHYPITRVARLGAFSPSGRHVLFAGDESAAHVWRADRAQVEADLEGHPTAVVFGAFVGEELVVTGTDDGMLRVWDWANGKLVSKLALHESGIKAGEVRGIDLATAGSDGRIAAWHLPSFDGDAATLRQFVDRGPFVLRQGVLTVKK